MTEQRYRERPRHAGPSPAQVLAPAVAVVLALLLLALLVRPAAFVVSVGQVAPSPGGAAAAPQDAAGPPQPGPAQAAPPRQDPDPSATDPAEGALAVLVELLRGRDAAALSGDAAAWTAASGDPTDAAAPDGSLAVLTSLPLTSFRSTVVPDSLRPVDDAEQGDAERGDDAGQGEDWQARVETVWELAGSTAVVRADTVRMAPTADGPGWRVVSWTPYPALGEVGTAAPWDLGPVQATVGSRGVVLSWPGPPVAPADESVPSSSEDTQVWAARVAGWVERGAVVVDSYLGTGWPRTTVVLVPATSEQYDALVPGPVPERPDVFAAVTTDVRTPDGGGDVVVLNPAARAELVEDAWQVTVTHELVHVASGARYGDGQEIWLAEGVADLVGWSTVVPATASREEVAGRLLDRVGTGRADLSALPDSEDFSSSDQDVVGDAYEGAWLAASLLEDEIGLDELLRVYELASQGQAPAPERTDAALLEVTGQGRDAFVVRWREHVTGLAGP